MHFCLVHQDITGLKYDCLQNVPIVMYLFFIYAPLFTHFNHANHVQSRAWQMALYLSKIRYLILTLLVYSLKTYHNSFFHNPVEKIWIKCFFCWSHWQKETPPFYKKILEMMIAAERQFPTPALTEWRVLRSSHPASHSRGPGIHESQ